MPMFDTFSPSRYAGCFERQKTSQYAVSIWYIPGGNYTNARVTNIFFDEKKYAEAFAKHWGAPPEMAMVSTIEQYDEVQRKIALHEKKRLEDERYYGDLYVEQNRHVIERDMKDEMNRW